MPRIERLLGDVDARCARWIGAAAWPATAKRWVKKYLELAYLLVYLVVPAGAIWLTTVGHADALAPFWATVLLAAFASYGMLPWIQTRPPRAVAEFQERAPDGADWLRRMNLWILGRASIQVNTVPSGHAATATAVALAVGAAIPQARLILFILSASIVVATIVGRYHYALDSAAGVLVGAGAWAAVRALH
jgi:membrane-associated phospholipid phosphatase